MGLPHFKWISKLRCGITFEIMEQALNQAKDGRLHILGEMNKALSASRSDVGKHTPKMEKINVDKKDIAFEIMEQALNQAKVILGERWSNN